MKSLGWGAILLACTLAAGAATVQAACPPAPPPPDLARYQAPPTDWPDRGLLWRLQKDGTTSWLFGTLHLGRVEWRFAGAQVLKALRSSDVAVFELDFAQLARNGVARPQADAAEIARVLDAARRERIRARAERDCVAPATLDGMPALLQVASLMLAEARREGLHPELAADLVLALTALNAGKPVVGLETVQQQVQLMAGGDDAAQRHSVDESLDALERGEAARVVNGLARAWEDGDEQAIADFMQALAVTADERAELRRFNDDRNAPMADKLAALHAQGRGFFAAVGTAHMLGPQALPVLLRERGFSVERVRFHKVPP